MTLTHDARLTLGHLARSAIVYIRLGVACQAGGAVARAHRPDPEADHARGSAGKSGREPGGLRRAGTRGHAQPFR